MQLSERFNFNSKLMDFCPKSSGWKQDETAEEVYLGRFAGCLERTVIAEQIFRAELTRPRPGLPEPTPTDE